MSPNISCKFDGSKVISRVLHPILHDFMYLFKYRDHLFDIWRIFFAAAMPVEE